MTPVYLVAPLLLLPLASLAQSNSEEAAIRELWQRFEEAYNSNDAGRVSGLYLPDGDRINGDLETARGRTEIAAQYQQELAKRKADPSTLPAHARIAIRLLDSQVALLDGEFEEVSVGKRIRGQFTAVLKKGPNGWQIAAGRVRGVKQL